MRPRVALPSISRNTSTHFHVSAGPVIHRNHPQALPNRSVSGDLVCLYVGSHAHFYSPHLGHGKTAVPMSNSLLTGISLAVRRADTDSHLIRTDERRSACSSIFRCSPALALSTLDEAESELTETDGTGVVLDRTAETASNQQLFPPWEMKELQLGSEGAYGKSSPLSCTRRRCSSECSFTEEIVDGCLPLGGIIGGPYQRWR